MLVLGRCLLLLLFSILIQLSYQQNICQDSPSICTDCFDWCPTQKPQCENSLIKSFCRVTCTACTSNNPVCLQLNCAQRCILPNTTSSDSVQARCGCFEGFELNTDGRSCIDINECEREPSICNNVMGATLCRNQQGSYACVACEANEPDRIWGYFERSECCLRNRTSTCGKSATNGGRIVGGDNAAIQYWPWMAYMRVGSNLCGGTLISENYILTAAHCVATIVNTPDNILILMGVVDITDETNVHAQTLRAKKITVHPNYRFPDNDIAVIELTTSVTISTFAQPVCLPGGETPRDGDICYATGFGATSERGAASPVLQQVDLPIANISVCQQAYENRTNDVDPALHICAGYTEGGKDSCQGDSGGPLVCQRCANCDWYLAGITSFGRGCARPGFYGVYTNVTRYESWISEVTIMPQEQQGQCVKPSWHEWGSWSMCSVTCGIGERTRVRFCMNGQVNEPGCMGEDTMYVECNAVACTGTGWSSWTQGPCSATCGEGTRRNTRQCINGIIGDQGCESGGESTTEDCFIVNCPTWNNWGAWSGCSISCGRGVRTSERVCNNFGQTNAVCNGSSSRNEECFRPCWGGWSQWSECSLTCGGGSQNSTRMCQFGDAGDIGCPGDAMMERSCNENVCPGHWSDWAPAGPCSVSCGTGQQRETRQCIGSSPGSPGCTGDTERFASCNTQVCPAEWGPFGEYSPCTATCGGGNQVRTRPCIGGPVGTGNCLGGATQTENCNTQICSNDPCGTNLLGDQTCCGYRVAGFCEIYRPFMDIQCFQACCRFDEGQACLTGEPGVSPPCRDLHPTCPNLGIYCGLPNVSGTCPLTCNTCPQN